MLPCPPHTHAGTAHTCATADHSTFYKSTHWQYTSRGNHHGKHWNCCWTGHCEGMGLCLAWTEQRLEVRQSSSENVGHSRPPTAMGETHSPLVQRVLNKSPSNPDNPHRSLLRWEVQISQEQEDSQDRMGSTDPRERKINPTQWPEESPKAEEHWELWDCIWVNI